MHLEALSKLEVTISDLSVESVKFKLHCWTSVGSSKRDSELITVSLGILVGFLEHFICHNLPLLGLYFLQLKGGTCLISIQYEHVLQMNSVKALQSKNFKLTALKQDTTCVFRHTLSLSLSPYLPPESWCHNPRWGRGLPSTCLATWRYIEEVVFS